MQNDNPQNETRPERDQGPGNTPRKTSSSDRSKYQEVIDKVNQQREKHGIETDREAVAENQRRQEAVAEAYRAERAKQQALREEQERMWQIEQALHKRHTLWNNSGLPLRHRKEHAKGNYRGEKWLSCLGAATAQVLEGNSLILVGKRGTGKTQMATAIAHAVIDRLAWSVKYNTATGVIAEYRAACYKGDTSHRHWMNANSKIKLFIIDEIHMRKGTEDEQMILEELIDARYGRLVPTIIIANNTKKGLKENLGESIADRLRETGTAVVCDWGGYRGG